jgi:hypothetical protein
MSGGFPDRARAELGLTGPEARLVAELGLRSYDALHAMLLASPTLSAETIPIRREHLLARLEPLLSKPYRRALREPVEAPSTPGARPPAPGPAPPGAPAAPLTPGLRAIDLVGEAMMDEWLPRDQRGGPTCIAYAATACVEWLLAEAGRPGVSLSPVFLYQRMRARGSGAAGAEDGATRFSDAFAVLDEEGVCTEATWPETKKLDAEPDAAAKREAARLLARRGFYWSGAPGEPRPANLARIVYDLLAQRRPVALALPTFRDPQSPATAPNNWWLTPARLHGILGEPPAHWDRSVGHAVCVLGFQPEAGAPGNGWFIFRNSMGARWATRAPDELSDDPPQVPRPGYGAISAAHVEAHAWELYSPQLGS